MHVVAALEEFHAVDLLNFGCGSCLIPDSLDLSFYFCNLILVPSSLVVWDHRVQFVDLLLVLPIVDKENISKQYVLLLWNYRQWQRKLIHWCMHYSADKIYLLAEGYLVVKLSLVLKACHDVSMPLLLIVLQKVLWNRLSFVSFWIMWWKELGDLFEGVPYLRSQFSLRCQNNRYGFHVLPVFFEPYWLGVIELNRTFSNLTLMGPEFFFTTQYYGDTFVEELFLWVCKEDLTLWQYSINTVV